MISVSEVEPNVYMAKRRVRLCAECVWPIPMFYTLHGVRPTDRRRDVKLCLGCRIAKVPERRLAKVSRGGPAAHQAVAYAIRKGELRRPSEFPCADCGGKAVEYDHRDYNKPLEVEPVCRRCNLRRGPAIPVAR